MIQKVMSHTYTGRLISLEGIDGSGKSTLARNLSSMLETQGFKTLLTKEPGATKLGAHLRTIVHSQESTLCDKAEYLLFAADRAQHFEEIIIPALKTGIIVIADRLADSSLAYQGYGRGVNTTMINTINAWATQGISPDLTFYLDLNPLVALERVTKRREDLTSFERESVEFWKSVISGYEKIFKERTNVVKLDALLSQTELGLLALNEILKIINSSLRQARRIP